MASFLIFITLELLGGKSSLPVPFDLRTERARGVSQRAQSIGEHPCPFSIDHDHCEALVVVQEVAQGLYIGATTDINGILDGDQEGETRQNLCAWQLKQATDRP